MGSTCSLCLNHTLINNNTPTSTIIVSRYGEDFPEETTTTTKTSTNINRKVYASTTTIQSTMHTTIHFHRNMLGVW
jgi:hypothetical protein